MLKIILFFILPFPLFANEGLIFDLKNVREVKSVCNGEPAAGKYCILHCVTATNLKADRTFKCNLEGKGTFFEKDSENSLVATDLRYLIVYPLQKAEICFNFGKTTTDFWELRKWEILNPNNSCQEILDDYHLYIISPLGNNF